MNQEDLNRLLEQGLSGDPPRPEFRDQVLRGSLATFAQRRRDHVIRRTAALSAAAVVIAGVSFLLGRYGAPRGQGQAAPVVTPVAVESPTVAVPSELVAWLDAARLFRQLGMEERMARAVDHAHKLRPYGTAADGETTESVVATGTGVAGSWGQGVGPRPKAGPHEPIESMNRVMAQSFGE